MKKHNVSMEFVLETELSDSTTWKRLSEIVNEIDWEFFNVKRTRLTMDLKEIPPLDGEILPKDQDDPLFDPYIDPATNGPTIAGIIFLQQAGWEQRERGWLLWWREPHTKNPRQFADAVRMQREFDKNNGGG
jgi:hypothetical protein